MRQNYNKKNKGLALLGQGKWKHALGCALLLFGMLAFGVNNAWAQDPIPDAVKLDKHFIPDDATGHSGRIVLETYVTGKVTQVTAAQPTDIILVLDYSMSMSYNRMPYGNQTITREEALEIAVESFIDKIFQDAKTNSCEHRMAVVKFSSQDATSLLSTARHYTYGGTGQYVGFNTARYQEALVVVNDNGSLNTRLTNASLFDNVGTDNGTVMNAGLNAAYQILLARAQSGGGGTTFRVPNTTTDLPRNMVVVFFTDGYPTASHGGSETTLHDYWQEDWDMDDVSDAACVQASNIKGVSVTSNGSTAHPKVYSIGVNPDCHPDQEYKTTYEQYTTGSGWNQQTFYAWGTGVKCLNGLLHFISSDYDNTLTSWSNHTTNTDFRNPGFYLAAQNANDLIAAFGTISSSSGSTPVTLGSSTVMQDIISPNFMLPEGTDVDDITVYAPKVTNATGTEGNYVLTFAEPTTAVDEHGDVLFLTLNNGIVVDDDDLENRIDPNDLNITISNRTLKFSGFDFSGQFCGPIVEGSQITGCEGRKLVIEFPIEIAEGVWGDGLNTNDELSFVTPDGTIQYQFPMPIADVAADVWTEVIVEQPSTFTYNSTKEAYELHNPEDLAWFVSWVNGRLKYESPYNTIIPHPSANAILMADIDMSAHNWVPIGEGINKEVGYNGTFDGNGHVITGLKNNASKYYKLDKIALVYPGMFSNVKGTVKNLFVLDADFHAKNHLLNESDEFKTFIHFGIIADTLSSTGTIFNCEAAGRLMCNNDTETVHPNNETQLARDMQIIIGGLVGYNDGGTIHSSMAMAELTGYTMGGMIGVNNGSFSNGFTNGVYNYLDNNATGKYAGGIAGTNTGTIDNCYVRFERTTNSNLTKLGTGFGMIYGSNSGTENVTNCYIPQISTFTRPTANSTTTETNTNHSIPNVPEHPSGYSANSNSYTLSVTPTFYNMFINDNMTGGTWGTWEGFNVYENGTPLLDKLIAGKGNGASWKRTTAGAYFNGSGDINDDYPILVFNDYTCVGSADGIRLDYATSLNEMLHRHNNGNMNENTKISNEYTQSKPNYYKVTEHRAIYKGAINLYANDDVTLEQAQPSGKDGEAVADNSTAEGVVVYIDENISLLQDASSSIEAYTGQTLQAYDNTTSDAGERWHNVSSSLSNSQFGWSYGTTGQVTYNHNSNPCGWTLPHINEDQAFFPIDMFNYHLAEFYCFYETMYHWINFRRNSVSHWHMDLIDDSGNPDDPNNHQWIDYINELGEHENEDHFIPGKGYLTCVDMSTWWNIEINEITYSKNAQFIQNRGTLNNGEITIPVTYTAANEWTGLAGYNLLGNPYQSYLDFATFASVNSDLWDGDANAMTYAVYDPTLGIYAQATATGQASQGAFAATGDINMHQGFFICAKKSGTATFNNTMRSNTPAAGTHFRGERLNYPVINLIATDRQGNTDVAVLEVGRPENGGGEKLRVGSATGRISLRHDNTDFGILFRDMTEGSQPLRFETQEDGTFTLSWNTANANFSSLTLVDNITGVNYDMLAHDSYEFEGRASDYKSRFKILIGEFTDVEENEETVTNNFAFFDGSEWVVNGKGQLTVADVMGRTVYTGNLTNDQNRVSLKGLSQGVYLMQVHSANGTMVQKIVVR